MKIDQSISWMQDKYPASHWIPAPEGNGRVVCKLSPRNCNLADGQMGKCGVRGNIGGQLFSFNYGKSVEATMEFIETEAVNHYRPGARILSLGNIGCMMSCDFCQNWRTSQVRHLDPNDVRTYSPEAIVETCKRLGIGVISWTYNDPVVWHEFVVATSRLAQRAGIRTLYKSAFYIEPDAVDELIDCIDIFSVSLKSMDQKFYRKFTGGTHLKPVLDMIEKVHRSPRHLEISQLLITKRNDRDEEIHKTNSWVLEHLGDSVPLHYVAFHPAYLYTDVERTSGDVLIRARELALKAGIKYCYAGNMFKEGVANTHCPECGTVTIERYGLKAEPVALDENGCCTNCGASNDVVEPYFSEEPADNVWEAGPQKTTTFKWNAEANSVHIEVTNRAGPCEIEVTRIGGDVSSAQTYPIGGVLKRCIASRQSDDEVGIQVKLPEAADISFFPVLDRAHFPTSEDISREVAGYRESKEVDLV